MKLIILDRDGVINQDRDDFVKSVDEWVPIEGSMDAIAFLTEADYTIAVATNQSGVARKYFSLQDLTGIWFCPHTADAQCECRKPKPGMVKDIIERFNAEAKNTWMVGDSLRDLQAIAAVGGKPALVLTGKGKKTLAVEGSDLPENTQIFDNLLAFSQYLLQQEQQSEAAK